MSLADFWDIQRPAVKRIKREERSLDPRPRGASEISSRDNGPEDAERTSSSSLVDPDDVGPLSSTIPANNDKIGIESQLESGQTELESSLLPVKMDQEAIEHYEASQAAATEAAGAASLKVQEGERQQDPSIRERLEARNWQKGRSSIYVDAFNLALETVLEEEAHLFDEAEREVFRHWQALTYESQYL
jgi:fanconi-associated nuclease 1